MGQSLAIDELIKKLADKLRAETAFQRDLFKLLVGSNRGPAAARLGATALSSDPLTLLFQGAMDAVVASGSL